MLRFTVPVYFIDRWEGQTLSCWHVLGFGVCVCGGGGYEVGLNCVVLGWGGGV